eukprot:2746304-Rhodomonas_salina.4
MYRIWHSTRVGRYTWDSGTCNVVRRERKWWSPFRGEGHVILRSTGSPTRQVSTGQISTGHRVAHA